MALPAWLAPHFVKKGEYKRDAISTDSLCEEPYAEPQEASSSEVLTGGVGDGDQEEDLLFRQRALLQMQERLLREEEALLRQNAVGSFGDAVAEHGADPPADESGMSMGLASEGEEPDAYPKAPAVVPLPSPRMDAEEDLHRVEVLSPTTGGAQGSLPSEREPVLRPHPLLPLRKLADEDEWVEEQDLAEAEAESLYSMVQESPDPRPRYRRGDLAAACDDRSWLLARGDLVGPSPGDPEVGQSSRQWSVQVGGEEQESRVTVASRAENSIVLAGEGLVGLEAAEERIQAWRKHRDGAVFMLVHLEEEPAKVEGSKQVEGSLPRAVRQLISSVGVSEECLPDVTCRRHLSVQAPRSEPAPSAPAPTGTKPCATSGVGSKGTGIKCASATAQGRALSSGVGLRSKGGRRPKASVAAGGPRSTLGAPAKTRARLRRHLVMCAVKGTSLEFWKPSAVPSVRAEAEVGAQVAEGADGREALDAVAALRGNGHPYRGRIALTGASYVQVDRIGYELKVHVVHPSSDLTDTVTDTYTFLQAPEHVGPRRELADVRQSLEAAIVAARLSDKRSVAGPANQTLEYDADPIVPHVKSVKSAPPLWDGVIVPLGYEDAPLLDGYIPHFLQRDGEIPRSAPSHPPETAAFASQFEVRKHQLYAALHKLKSTSVGSRAAAHAIKDLLQRQHSSGSESGAAAASTPPAPRSAVHERGERGDFSKTLVGIGGGDVKQADGNKGDNGLLGAEGLQGLGLLSAGDGAGVSCAAASEPDFSKYRYVEGNEEDVLGRSALVWDVEQVGCFLAVRHTSSGITLVLNTARADISAALVTAGGAEFRYLEHDGLSEQLLAGVEREAIFAFASRFAQGGEGGGGWEVRHRWDMVSTYGSWTLVERTRSRCVAVHSADSSGGVHFLPNGIVFFRRDAALVHLTSAEGPVGPIELTHAAALKVFCDLEEQRPDAPHSLCLWRPLAQQATSSTRPDIEQLEQQRCLLATQQRMPPLNATVAGQPPFEWSVLPSLPAGLHLVPIDAHSAQISGVPQTTAEACQYRVCASNKYGKVEAGVSVTIMSPPKQLTYASSLLELAVGTRTTLKVASLSGSAPINFKCSRRLPRGLRLEPVNGMLSGVLESDPEFPPRSEIEVTIVAANLVGSCEFRIILCHGARSLVPLEPLDILSHNGSISEDQTASRRRAILSQKTQSGHYEQIVRILPPEEQQPQFH